MKNAVCVISVVLGLAVSLFFCCEAASAATVEPNFIAMNPNPADGQTHVPVEPNLTLTWDIVDVNTDGYTIEYDVYYGTDQREVERSTTPPVIGIETTRHTLSGLEHDTVYFWRIDTRVTDWDPQGLPFPVVSFWIIKGSVWSFRTMPRKAWDPEPADGEINVATEPNLTLTWSLGDVDTEYYTMIRYDVYVGVNESNVINAWSTSPEYLGTTEAASYTITDEFESETQYFWRIDTILISMRPPFMNVTITGEVWSFTTMPLKAWDPDPGDGTEDVEADPNVTLSWKLGDFDALMFFLDHVRYGVYYGTDFAEVSSGWRPDLDIYVDTSVQIGPLMPRTTYYWRIDTNLASPRPPHMIYRFEGDVWSFTTWPGPPRVITVDDDGPADFNNIQAAIVDSYDGDTVEVHPGTYSGPGNYDIDFLGKAITVTGTDPDDPNTVAQTIIDCNASAEAPHRGFYFHNNEDANSVLAGLTITNGYSPQEEIDTHAVVAGGGIFCQDSSPTITKCTIVENWAGLGMGSWEGLGGGICSDRCDPTISYCTISHNSAQTGGGIHCGTGHPTITNCTITENYVDGSGGGVCLYRGWEALISNCTVMDNSAEYGGGIRFSDSVPTISNCVISRNTARGRPGSGIHGKGGGIWGYRSGPVISNCVISSNRSEVGGGICLRYGGPSHRGPAIVKNCTIFMNQADTGRDYLSRGGGIYCYERCDVEVRNSILWGNFADLGKEIALRIWWEPNEISIAYSNIEGGLSAIYVEDCIVDWGQSNIDADPCFADPGYWDTGEVWVQGSDYHLKSQAGRYDLNSDTWVIDDVTSLCIDAGDPMSPIGPEPFPNGGIINMGAYGGTGEASKSYFGQPPCETIMAGDVNGDCEINFEDFRLMALHWCEN